MKIGKYIFEILPSDAINITFGLPYSNNIIWENGQISFGVQRKENYIKAFNDKNRKGIFLPIEYMDRKGSFSDRKLSFKKSCKHLKPNTGIRYQIIGLYGIVLIIKQLN